MRKLTATLFIFVIFLTSCATTRNVMESAFPVNVTNKIKVPLFPTEFMGGEIESLELFEGKFPKISISANMLFSANKETLSVTLLNPFGATVGNLFYDGKNLDFKSAFFPKNFKAQYIVFDIQLAFYDADSIKKELKKYKLDFKAQKSENNIETRLLKEKGKLITEIKIENEKTTIINHLRGYTYVITNLGM